MILLSKKISREDIALFGLVVIFISLVLSKFVLSIGMIILILNSLLLGNLKQDFRKFLQRKELLIITSFFFICLLSGTYSEDLNYFLERMRIKLPFLLLPFAFGVLQPLSEKRFYFLLSCFIFVITATSSVTFIAYLNDIENMNKLYLIAQVIPTPVNHIHFSLMVALAVVSGIFLLSKDIYLKFRWEKILISLSVIFLFVFIHLLAVRSGLVALYLGLTGMIVHYVIDKKKYLAGILSFIIIFSFPYVAYKTIPTFRNKIGYAQYDLAMYSQGDNPGKYPDGGRMYSYRFGWELAKNNFLLGVGYGDIENEMNRLYDEHIPETKKRLLPHNQFLLFLSSMGVIGLICFLIVFSFPVFYHRNYRNILLLSFTFIMLVPLMVEPFIETQIGTAFYLVFLLLILNQSKTSLFQNRS